MWWGLFYQVWNHKSLGEDTQRRVALDTYFKKGFHLVTKLCPTLCDPMDCSTPDFPVLCYLPDFVQTHVHWVGNATHLSHPLHPLLLLPSIFPNIRVFPSDSASCIRWPKYWSFSFSISPSSAYLGLISFRIAWFDLFAVRGTLRSLLQHRSSVIREHNLKMGLSSAPCTLWNSEQNY